MATDDVVKQHFPELFARNKKVRDEDRDFKKSFGDEDITITLPELNQSVEDIEREEQSTLQQETAISIDTEVRESFFETEEEPLERFVVGGGTGTAGRPDAKPVKKKETLRSIAQSLGARPETATLGVALNKANTQIEDIQRGDLTFKAKRQERDRVAINVALDLARSGLVPGAVIESITSRISPKTPLAQTFQQVLANPSRFLPSTVAGAKRALEESRDFKREQLATKLGATRRLAASKRQAAEGPDFSVFKPKDFTPQFINRIKDKDTRERSVPNEGLARTKGVGVKFGAAKVATQKSIATVNSLLKIVDDPAAFKSFRLGFRGRSLVHRQSLKGTLRLLLIGPGAMSDLEQEILEEVVGDPTGIFTVESVTKEKLETLQNLMIRGLAFERENAGFILSPEDAALIAEGKAQGETRKDFKSRRTIRPGGGFDISKFKGTRD